MDETVSEIEPADVAGDVPEMMDELAPRPRTCGSCRLWDVRIRRSRALENSVAYCLLPEFSPFRLIVSGASGCDRWSPQE